MISPPVTKLGNLNSTRAAFLAEAGRSVIFHGHCIAMVFNADIAG